jgi:hypothetical protein
MMEEEFHKRREGRVKRITNVLSKSDQIHFLSEAAAMFPSKEVGI